MNNEKQKNDNEWNVAALGEKALDITLGLASLGVEAAGFAARYVSDKGPEWVANLEERGKPLRERLLGREQRTAAPAAEPELSSEEEISALENRIRELEKQVDTDQTDDIPPVVTHPTNFIPPDVDDDVPEVRP